MWHSSKSKNEDCIFNLPNGPGELVVIHGWSIFSKSPQTGDSNAVFNFENASTLIQPTNTRAVLLSRLEKKFFQKLPQMNMCTAFGSMGPKF